MTAPGALLGQGQLAEVQAGRIEGGLPKPIGTPAKEPDLGKKLVKQLGKFLKKATKKIEKGRQFAADPKKAAKAPKQLAGADKLLGKFLGKLGSADPAVAASLIDLVQFIRDQLARALS